MPFTISHAVIAAPIAKLTGYRLPISALAIGSMTPDLYRLFTSENYNASHHWQGIIIPNLFIGLFFCLLWYGLWRPAIFRWIGMVKPLGLGSLDKWLGFILSVITALLIGISTHLIWDGLTHSDFRTFAFDQFLSQNTSLFGHSYPVHRVLQIGTSALALPFMLWILIHYYFKFKQKDAVPRRIKRSAYVILSLSLLTACAYYLRFFHDIGFQLWTSDLYSFIGQSVNRFCRMFLITLSLGCLIFLILDRKSKQQNTL